MKVIFWPLVILASASAITTDVLLNIQTPLRPYLAFWFLLICPGMAFIPLLRIRQGLTALALGVALSLILDTVVAEILVVAGIWSIQLATLVLVGLSFFGLLLQLAILLPEMLTRIIPR